jgi:hypothetical protein
MISAFFMRVETTTKECSMDANNRQLRAGPKTKDRRHSSYDESADEPPQLIEKETTDIEKESPADETEAVQRLEDQEDIRPPAFDE